MIDTPIVVFIGVSSTFQKKILAITYTSIICIVKASTYIFQTQIIL